MSSTTDDDPALVQALGLAIDSNLSRLAAQSLFYGFFLIIFAYNIALSWKRGLRAFSSRFTLFTALLSFSVATAHWGATVAFDLIQIRGTLIHNLDVDLSTRIDLTAAQLFKPDLVDQWAGLLMPLISDAVVIWRAWWLYSEYRFVIILPMMTLLADIGVTLAFLVLICNYDSWRAFASNVDGPNIQIMNRLQLASFTLSFCTNVIATLMIGFQLWKYRSFIKQLWGSESKLRERTIAERVMGILVESGLVYAIFQLAFLCLAFAPANTSTAYSSALFLTIYTQLSAIYPLLILCIIKLQLSFVDPSLGQMSTLNFSDAVTPIASESTRDPGTQSGNDIRLGRFGAEEFASVDGQAGKVSETGVRDLSRHVLRPPM